MERQTDRQTDGRTDRQTDRQTDICDSRVTFVTENSLEHQYEKVT